MDAGRLLEKLSEDIAVLNTSVGEIKVELGVVSAKVDHTIKIHETICRYHELQFTEHEQKIEQLQKDQKTTNDYIASSSGALKLSAWLVATVSALVGIYIAFVPK